MAEYIEREAFKQKYLCCGYLPEMSEKEFDEFPTADVAPVAHGQWCVCKIRSIETVFYCSECKRTVTVGNDFFGEAPQSVSAAYPYCHCGAKMDGGNGA